MQRLRQKLSGNRDGTWASQSTSQENTEKEGARAEGQSGKDKEDAEAMHMNSGEGMQTK